MNIILKIKTGKVWYVLIVCFVLLGMAASGMAADLPSINQNHGKPLKIFIRAGQSNIKGHARDYTFKGMATDPLTKPLCSTALQAMSKNSVSQLLQMAAQPDVQDPHRILQTEISTRLFGFWPWERGGRCIVTQQGLAGVDRCYLAPAVKSILTNDNGLTRYKLTKTLYPLLTDNELNQLWGDIYRATRFIAPSGIMFAAEPQVDGLNLMAKHHVKEGMFLAAWFVRWQKDHGKEGRISKALKALEAYGVHAQEMIPYLNEHRSYYSSLKTRGSQDIVKLLNESIERIKASQDKPALISIEKYLNKDDIPPRDGR